MIFEYDGPDFMSYLPVVSIYRAGGRFYNLLENIPGTCLVVLPGVVATYSRERGSWYMRIAEAGISNVAVFTVKSDYVNMLHTGVDNL